MLLEQDEMSLAAAAAEDEEPSTEAEIHLPADINWEMLDKSRFFILGAALFSGVSTALYLAVVLKTRLQISNTPLSSTGDCEEIGEGGGGYRGLGPRWMSMSLSATTMITTYEFLKRLSAKNLGSEALG